MCCVVSVVHHTDYTAPMLCYVVGFRQLMHCSRRLIVQTLVFSRSYVHRQVSPPETLGVKGEKWPVISTESCDFHAYTFGLFYMPQICDMGQTALFTFRRKAWWGFFRPEKHDGFGRRFEPANLGTKGQHATSRPPKPHSVPKLWIRTHYLTAAYITPQTLRNFNFHYFIISHFYPTLFHIINKK